MGSKKSITIKLDKFTQAKYLNDCILHEKKAGNNSVSVKIQDSFTGSNVCAPIAGIIAFHRASGTKVFVDCPKDSYASHTHLFNPVDIEGMNFGGLSPFDKVFTFSSEDGVAKIVNLYTSALRESDELERGIIQSLEWCINEAIDNVLQHSCSEKGYVMAQIQRQSKIFNFCVFDTGVGIFNSLKGSKHKPKSALQAIELALQERVTRDERIGQGNGLWGLSRIIKETNGRLLISSCGSSYSYNNGKELKIKNGDFNLGHDNGTTMLDFQLDYSRPIDVTRALNGHTPLDIWAEQHENENGEIVVDVAKEAKGTGTRKAAERLRNVVMNFLKEGYSSVNLDFRNVNLISSSFADELIGKLIGTLGFSTFMQYIVISNLNDFNSSIVNRSVCQRMAQIFMDEKISEED